MSSSLDDLRSLLEALEHLEHRGQVDRRRGEDVLAVVVEDEVGVEVPWPDRGALVPGVAVISVLHVLLGLMDHCLVAPSVSADVVAAYAISPGLVTFTGSRVGVIEDDEDPALLQCR